MKTPTKSGDVQRQSFVWRTGKAVLRISVTLGIVAASLLAVSLGSDELSRRADAAPDPAPAPLIPVQTAPITLVQGYDVTRSFIGQVEARRTTAVSFELSGQVDRIFVDEGDRVDEGQLFAVLDTRPLKAERARLEASKAALKAQLLFAEQTVERQTQLRERGASSQASLDQATSRQNELYSRLAEADAALWLNAIQLEKSQVSAPFAGRITERFVDGGESVAPGQSVLGLVEVGAPLLRVGVPLDITASDLSTVVVDAADTPQSATLVALRPDVDPVTRTRTAIFELDEDADLAIGQTARINLISRVETPGIWVPMTTLKEGQRGQWTLLAVDADDTVRAVSVQVVHTKGDQVFVRGAFPQDVRLITAGPQRVTVGQSVASQPAS